MGRTVGIDVNAFGGVMTVSESVASGNPLAAKARDGISVCDSHVHFWDPRVLRYPWLDTLPLLNKPFLPRDYLPFALGTVDSVIFVEANCDGAQSDAEVQWIRELAARHTEIAGIVAHVNMLDANVRTDAIKRARSSERVVGIRHNIQDHERGYCTQPAFVQGVQEVGEAGLVFDLCATGDQLADVAALVEQCASTLFVLDHCGKPAVRDNAFESWSPWIDALAQFPNVACKLSGLFTESLPQQRTEHVLSQYAGHVVGAFGHDRVMYGSDWPVVELAGGESRWRMFAAQYTSRWATQHRQAFFVGNAERIYKILQTSYETSHDVVTDAKQ